jgi:agmatine deiminase
MWPRQGEVSQTYADVAHAIRAFEPVTMVVPPHKVGEAENFLGADIDLLPLPIDDSWSRDNGPNFVVDDAGAVAGVCFGFNAWGGKYAPFDQDARLAERILDHLGFAAIHSPLIAEGGGFCVDGEGTLLTTDTCFPNVNRNPGWSQPAIEAELMRTLGVGKVLWLPGDPDDQETDGHVDGIAMLVRPGVVLVEATSDPDDPRRPYFAKLWETLEQCTDARGRRFELVSLPEARDARGHEARFCRSYVNFYFANGAIIAPAYGIHTDGEVLERLQSIFPERSVVQVRIDPIAEGGGGIHCITQQQPCRR